MEPEASEPTPASPVETEAPEASSEPSVEPEASEPTSQPAEESETPESPVVPSEEPEAAEPTGTEAPETPEASSAPETTAAVTEAETTSTAPTTTATEEDNSASNGGESGSNEGSNASPDSTEAPSAESGAESNEASTVHPQAPGSGEFVCPAAGRFANPTDCHKYYVCFWLPFGLYSLEQNCLAGYAYNPSLERCTADQSVCFPGEFTCMGPGRFPDPADPTSYFWCVWNMFGGYLQYKMQCPMGQVYNAFRGRCAFAVAGRSLPFDELDDELAAAEAAEESHPAEVDSVVEPVEPEVEPVAPVAEEQPKLKVKFQCLEEGTFADPNNCGRYFVCTLKKLDKFKKSKFKCAAGERFDPLMGMCVPDLDALCE